MSSFYFGLDERNVKIKCFEPFLSQLVDSPLSHKNKKIPKNCNIHFTIGSQSLSTETEAK
jgi:hypothetical protein